jgi:hypothetical protein
MKKPEPFALDEDFYLDVHDCRQFTIDPVLMDLQVKHWTDKKKITKYLRNI